MVSQAVSWIQIKGFTDYLLDREDPSGKAARILQAIREVRSPRLSAIAQGMAGNPAGRG